MTNGRENKKKQQAAGLKIPLLFDQGQWQFTANYTNVTCNSYKHVFFFIVICSSFFSHIHYLGINSAL